MDRGALPSKRRFRQFPYAQGRERQGGTGGDGSHLIPGDHHGPPGRGSLAMDGVGGIASNIIPAKELPLETIRPGTGGTPKLPYPRRVN